MNEPKIRPFNTGELVIVDDVITKMEDPEFMAFVYASYIRYRNNDWGDLENCDKKLNKRNIKHGGNLGGRYVDEEKGWEIWILTTACRTRTVICFPSAKKSGNDDVESETPNLEDKIDEIERSNTV